MQKLGLSFTLLKFGEFLLNMSINIRLKEN